MRNRHGDRLAQIEGWFTGTYAHYLTGEESQAVLALVEIAKACERAWSYGSTTLTSDDYYAIQAALARLDSGAAE